METNRLSSVVANAAFQISEKEAVKEITLVMSADKTVTVRASTYYNRGYKGYRVVINGFVLSEGINEHREDERILLIDTAKKYLEAVRGSVEEREKELFRLSEVARQERKDIECTYTTAIEVQI